MKIINNFRVEKDPVLKEWIAFQKRGISGWFEVRREDSFKNLKKWCEKQSKNKNYGR